MTVPATADESLEAVYAGIASYYTRKIRKHGISPAGVDWSCVPTQELRFVQLLKLCDFSAPFALNDLGCGYGALRSFIARRHDPTAIDYLGIDLSGAMIRRARRLWRDDEAVKFVQGRTAPRVADYSVASGIFNVRQDQGVELWECFVMRTLTQLHAVSRRGFAVNFIASPALGRPARPGVYQTDPDRWVRWCERELGGSADAVAGYGMREFTLLVRPAVQPALPSAQGNRSHPPTA